MNLLKILLLVIVAGNVVCAQNKPEFLKFKAKIGFVNDEDTIEKYKFLENGKKLVIIGQRNVQVWDVENAKQLSGFSYNVSEYSRTGKTFALLTLGLSTLIKWSTIEIDPRGEWFAAVENSGAEKKTVVRDLQTGRQLADLDSKDFLIDIKLDGREVSIEGNGPVTFEKKDEETKITFWNGESFQPESWILTERCCAWNKFIRNKEKLLTGSGEMKISWLGDRKDGANLMLWDVKTGKAEKEFTAASLKPNDYYEFTSVSKDEKFLMSTHSDRIFVWEIDGDGVPKYEISSALPKGKANFVDVVDGRFIIARVDGELRVYEFGGDGKPRIELFSSDPKKSFSFINSTADGKYFALKGDGNILIYKTEGGISPLARLTPTERSYVQSKLLEDGSYYVLANYKRKREAAKTEFYDVKTGDLKFEVPFALGRKTQFTADRKFLYTEDVGGSFVWNFAEKRFAVIPQKTRTNICELNAINCTETTNNTEHTLLSPNGKFIVRYGRNSMLTLFDVETGDLREQLFDPEKVKYDKQNKIKESGFDDVEFTENGNYFYAFDDSRWSGSHTITFWELVN